MSLPIFPDVPIELPITPDIYHGGILTKTADGADSERRQWNGVRLWITLEHRYLTPEEQAELEAFYAENANKPFTFVLNASAQTWRFRGPLRERYLAGGLKTLFSDLRQV